MSESLKSKYVLNGHDGVRHLIFHRDHPSNGEFVVFIDKDLDLDWESDNKFDTLIDSGSLKLALRKILNSDLTPKAGHFIS